MRCLTGKTWTVTTKPLDTDLRFNREKEYKNSAKIKKNIQKIHGQTKDGGGGGGRTVPSPLITTLVKWEFHGRI